VRLFFFFLHNAPPHTFELRGWFVPFLHLLVSLLPPSNYRRNSVSFPLFSQEEIKVGGQPLLPSSLFFLSLCNSCPPQRKSDYAFVLFPPCRPYPSPLKTVSSQLRLVPLSFFRPNYHFPVRADFLLSLNLSSHGMFPHPPHSAHFDLCLEAPFSQQN